MQKYKNTQISYNEQGLNSNWVWDSLWSLSLWNERPLFVAATISGELFHINKEQIVLSAGQKETTFTSVYFLKGNSGHYCFIYEKYCPLRDIRRGRSAVPRQRLLHWQ